MDIHLATSPICGYIYPVCDETRKHWIMDREQQLNNTEGRKEGKKWEVYEHMTGIPPTQKKQVNKWVSLL